MPTADFIIRHAHELYTCAGPAPRRGPAQGDAGRIADAAVAAFGGTLVFVGSTADCDCRVTRAPGARVISAPDCAIIPGFVDAHTHVVYAGNRVGELRQRLGGASYGEIAAEGGGILSTMRATREAASDTLVRESRVRLEEMLRCGTTTCEIKSGYGLELVTELKMLRAIRALAREQPIDLVATFLGAHEIPPEYRDRRHDYVTEVTDVMIPAVVREGLAEWCDVFCETGVYTPEESRAILQAGQRAGLSARLHADELTSSGGAQVAAAVGARSADHLIHVGPGGIRAMARAGTVATLLPSAAFYLKLGRYAPARDLIAEGVAVALATDVNPGGGFSGSMPFAMTLACFAMSLTVEEALVAATLNSAYSLNRHQVAGSLEAGKHMDAVVVRGDVANLLRVGAGAIAAVIKRGRLVVGTERDLIGG